MAEDGEVGTEFARAIGVRLAEIRKKSGIDRGTAAAAIGVSIQTYANRERGITELKGAELVVLADFFAVPVNEFFANLAWSPPAEKLPDLKGVYQAEEVEVFVRLLNRIPDDRIRRDVAEAVKAIARAETANDGPVD